MNSKTQAQQTEQLMRFLSNFFIYFLSVFASFASAQTMQEFYVKTSCGETKICTAQIDNNQIFCPAIKGICPNIPDCRKSHLEEVPLVYTLINVTITKDNSPVKDVNIFENSTNTLIGKTKEDGKFDLYAKEGTVIRIVEPKYGLQSKIFTVKRTSDKAPLGKKMLVGDGGQVGWTL